MITKVQDFGFCVIQGVGGQSQSSVETCSSISQEPHLCWVLSSSSRGDTWITRSSETTKTISSALAIPGNDPFASEKQMVSHRFCFSYSTLKGKKPNTETTAWHLTMSKGNQTVCGSRLETKTFVCSSVLFVHINYTSVILLNTPSCHPPSFPYLLLVIWSHLLISTV